MKRPTNILKFSDAPQDAELRVHTQRDHEKYLDAPIDQVCSPFVYCLLLNVPWDIPRHTQNLSSIERFLEKTSGSQLPPAAVASSDPWPPLLN